MNKVSSILHGHPRTYFHDLLAPAELSALLERGDSFHLEQVADPDAVALRIQEYLLRLGRSSRVEDQRTSLIDDLGTLLPFGLGMLLLLPLLGRQADSMLSPRTDVVIAITRQALAVRCRHVTGDASA